MSWRGNDLFFKFKFLLKCTFERVEICFHLGTDCTLVNHKLMFTEWKAFIIWFYKTSDQCIQIFDFLKKNQGCLCKYVFKFWGLTLPLRLSCVDNRSLFPQLTGNLKISIFITIFGFRILKKKLHLNEYNKPSIDPVDYPRTVRKCFQNATCFASKLLVIRKAFNQSVWI